MIQESEVKFLTQIGKTRDLINVKTQIQGPNLKIRDLQSRVDEYRQSWREHIGTMSEQKVTTEVKQYKPNGKRCVCRFRKR